MLCRLPFMLTCQLCAAPTPPPLDLCLSCKAALPWIAVPCVSCGLPLPDDCASQAYCGSCLHQPWPFTRTVIPWRYQYPLAPLVTGFKHSSRLEAGRLLASLMVETLQQRYADGHWPELVIPVPLHWRRLQWRGFNQSHELARQVSRALSLDYDSRLLCRHRAAPSQQGLNRRERLHNRQQGFALRRPLATRRVALLDDVVTTGSTVSSIGALLTREGASEIHLWALARTPLRQSSTTSEGDETSSGK